MRGIIGFAMAMLCLAIAATSVYAAPSDETALAMEAYRASARTTATSETIFYHTTNQGDSVSAIASQYGADSKQLQNANRASGSLQAGERIIVTAANLSDVKVAVVSSGDSLASIAYDHGVDVEALVIINHLDSDSVALETGRVLLIPALGANGGQVASVNSPLIQQIIDFAITFVGYPYVAAGASPNTGFDCSGFTHYVFSQFGINLSRSSSTQGAMGIPVAKSDLCPGDLVFFSQYEGGGVGHVGIFLGDIDGDGVDEFIHSANSTRGVVIDPFAATPGSYSSRNYLFAKRVIS